MNRWARVAAVAAGAGLALSHGVAGAGTEPDDSGADATATSDAVGGSAAPGGECPAPIEGTEDVVISISRPILAFAPVLLAMQNGAFEDAGLNVTIEPLAAAEALAPLSQGRIDASLTSYSAGYFNAADSGIDLRWVMPGYDANADSQEGYWVRTDVVGDAEEMDIAALAGETVGSPTAGTGAGGLVLAQKLEPAGLGLSDITLTQLAGTDALVGLENGAVAATWLSDPIWVEAQANPDLRYLGGYGPGINGSGLVAGPRFIERPDVLVAFLRVVSETSAAYLQEGFLENDEVVAHLATALDTTPEALQAGLPLGFDPTLNMDGAVEFLDELQALMQEQGVLEYDELIPGADLIDDSFAVTAASCAASPAA